MAILGGFQVKKFPFGKPTGSLFFTCIGKSRSKNTWWKILPCSFILYKRMYASIGEDWGGALALLKLVMASALDLWILHTRLAAKSANVSWSLLIEWVLMYLVLVLSDDDPCDRMELEPNVIWNTCLHKQKCWHDPFQNLLPMRHIGFVLPWCLGNSWHILDVRSWL